MFEVRRRQCLLVFLVFVLVFVLVHVLFFFFPSCCCCSFSSSSLLCITFTSMTNTVLVVYSVRIKSRRLLQSHSYMFLLRDNVYFML